MRRDLLIGLVLAALTLGIYWPVRNHDFIFYDDPQFITENAQIQSGLSRSTVGYALTRPVAGNWHPVTTLSHALDCELFGLNAGAHHLVNAAFHAANAALLFLLLQQLTRKQPPLIAKDQPATTKSPEQVASIDSLWPNAFIAIVFALHPLRVESVAWIAERKDLLSGFFFLLTLWMYALFVQKKAINNAQKIQPRMDTDGHGLGKADANSTEPHETPIPSSVKASSISVPHPCPSVSIRGFFPCAASGHRRASIFYALALTCFALGLMSKPMLVTVPFVLLLLDYWPLQRLEISDLNFQSLTLRILVFEKIPFLLLSFADCWITWAVQESAGAMRIIPAASWSERGGNAVTSYLRYLGKMFWPTDLAIVYPHPAQHYFLTEAWPGWEIALAALLLLMVSIYCLYQLRPRPCLAVGWFWFLGTLVPVIGLVQVGEQAMADRYTYIPLIGPVIGLVWCLSEGVNLSPAAQTWWPAARTLLYRRFVIGRATIVLAGSEQTGSRHDTVVPTASAMDRLKFSAAACGIAAALVLAATLSWLTRHQLAYWQNTVTLFEHAVAVTADNPSAQFALGVGLEQEGQVGRAMVRYRVAVAIDPHYAKAHYNMGQVLRKEGKWHESAEAYLAAARSNPADVPTQLNLASVLPHLGRTREAIDHFDRALELDPASIEGLNNLAWLLSTSAEASVRDGARAVQLAERACSLTEFKVPVLLGTLAAAYAEAGRFAEAVEFAQRACSAALGLGDSQGAARNQQLLELYLAKKPCRETQ